MTRAEQMITLLTGATTSAAPTVTTATLGKQRPFYADEALVNVHSTAGSDTMTALVHLWGWSEAASRWHYIGALNGAVALAEVAANYLSHSEIVQGIGKFSRFYCQLGTLGGTATAVTVTMDFVALGAHD